LNHNIKLKNFIFTVLSFLTGLLTASPAHASQFFQGDSEAKVQIVIYGDLECPYTKRLVMDLPKWESAFGNRIGVSLAHFPLSFHENAKAASIAAACADRHERFAKYVKALLVHQKSLSESTYLRVANELGLDENEFRQCLNSIEARKSVENDVISGLAHGVRGTPMSFINGELVSGAVPFENFKAVIEKHLALKNQGNR